MNISGLLGSWVVYSGDLARACGGVNAAIFASYVAFRSNGSPDGWVSLTQDEIERGTAISFDAQQTARTRLKASKVLEERADRLAHLFYYRLNEEALRNLLSPETENLRFGKPATSDSGVGDSPIRDTAQNRFGGRSKSDSYSSKEDVKEVSIPREEKDIALLDGPVPEWLMALRKAVPYKLTAAKETAFIRSVSTLGCAPERLVSAAESLASQWPYKQHKHIDMTLLSWLRRPNNGNGTAQTTDRSVGETPRGATPAPDGASLAKWRQPMGLQGKPVPPVATAWDTNGASPARLLDVPASHAADQRGETTGR